MNDEQSKLEAFVQKKQMTWLQGILGPRKDAWPTNLFAVRCYPTYFLISRDAHVIAYGHQGYALPELIGDALGASGGK